MSPAKLRIRRGGNMRVGPAPAGLGGFSPNPIGGGGPLGPAPPPPPSRPPRPAAPPAPAAPQAKAPPRPAAKPAASGRLPGWNAERNAYFGDLHVHTKLSFDAYIFNVRATPDDAYRFARGEAIGHAGGFNIRLAGGPLD